MSAAIRMSLVALLLFACAAGVYAAPAPAISLHVAVDGDDKNPGTLAEPLASLRAAVERVFAVADGVGWAGGDAMATQPAFLGCQSGGPTVGFRVDFSRAELQAGAAKGAQLWVNFDDGHASTLSCFTPQGAHPHDPGLESGWILRELPVVFLDLFGRRRDR